MVRILRRDDLERALGMAECIDAVEAAFVAYSSGRAELPGVIHLDVPEAGGEIHVKAGHLHGAPAYAVKVASGFAGGGEPAIDGLVLVFDATTGAPLAFLLDGGYLTDLRTGAAGGVAARWLAPERVGRVAVVGTGIQARGRSRRARVRPGGSKFWSGAATPRRPGGRDAGVGCRAVAEIGRPSRRDVVSRHGVAPALVSPSWCAPSPRDRGRIRWCSQSGSRPELLPRRMVLVVDRDQCARSGASHAPIIRPAVELARRGGWARGACGPPATLSD